MIIEKIIDLFFIPLNLLIDLLPSSIVNTVSNFELPVIVRYGACFFPMDVAITVVTLYSLWYTVFLTWAVIEWVYKKIPGVS